jgi:hypothetical protein
MNENLLEKKQRLEQIKELVKGFCTMYLAEELAGYALKLCETLGRRQKISITKGKKEIWAAAIVYVIARLNFLFDRDNAFYLSPDTICDFFGTNKSTTGNKASQIEKICNLSMGAEGFCNPEITDALTLVELPSGFVIPKNMLPKLIFDVEIADEEESKEIEWRLAEKRESAAQAKRERKAAEKKKNDRQLNLFDDFEA